MSGSSVFGGLLIAALLLPYGCGGRTTADSSSAPEEDASSNGGAGNTPDECLGGAPAGGCGGEAGEHSLEDYARLRAACDRNVRINRAGGPVTICYRIR